MHHDDEPHDLGLAHDLATLQRRLRQRRRALGWLVGAGAAGAVGVFGCGGGGDSTTDTATSSSSDSSSGGSGSGSGSGSGGTGSSSSGNCSAIPEETEGPYPGDGSNSSGGSIANALALSDIVRSDIRSSIAGASGVAQGVLLTLVLELVDTNGACADLAQYAIYVWHCDREGRYSMYSSGVAGENYLRGVQATASDGTVTFQTIFPGCYSGRWPHIHFEIYRSTNTASSWTNKLRTSQLALPADVCSAVYNGASGYSASVANLSRISLATDGIFSDGYGSQLATVTGDLASGYAARLQVGLAA